MRDRPAHFFVLGFGSGYLKLGTTEDNTMADQTNYNNPWQRSPGINNVPSYQVSGRPFATGSLTAPAVGDDPIKVEFPSVTRWIKVVPVTGSSATHLRIGFSENGVKGSNYFRYLAGNNFNHEQPSPEPLELKVTELYFCSDSSATVNFDIVAGLTGIKAELVPSNWSGSAGVG